MGDRATNTTIRYPTQSHYQDTEHTRFCPILVCLFYVLATSKVITGWVPTCDSAHIMRLHNAASLGHQTASIMIWYPTQSHCPDAEPNSPCSILIMPSARPWSNKYEFYKSLLLLDQGSNHFHHTYNTGAMTRILYKLCTECLLNLYVNVMPLPVCM